LARNALRLWQSPERALDDAMHVTSERGVGFLTHFDSI
jgi:hypothetical protein